MCSWKRAFMVVVATAMVGVWGCSQSPPPSSGNARLRELEARAARLEDDYRTAVNARDQARKKVNVLEEQRAQLAQQVDQMHRVVKERDDARQQAAVRAAERDAVQAQLVHFGKELQSLVSKIEQATAGVTATPVTSAPATVSDSTTK